MDNYIAVNTPLLNGNEKKYLNECIDTGWISSEGPFVKKLENDFAQRMGRKYGVAVANGTVALELAVRALDLEEGSEVILPSFTIISCIQAITKNNLKPVLVDSCSDTWNMDISQIREKITAKTKAIMVVHIYGLPVPMDDILALAKEFNLKIIEDAAEMHGQTYKGKPCGSFGDISVFSFYPNKLVTTGEGGMLVMDEEALSHACCYLRNLAFENPRFVHQTLGYNFRMTNIQAAIGLAQLERLNEFIEIKREMGHWYQHYLKDIVDIQLPIAETPYAKNIYWVFGIVLKNKTAKEMMQSLHEQGIGTRPFFFPMHLQPVFQKMGWFENESYPVAENLAMQGFYLPSGVGLKKSELIKVCEVFKNIIKR